MDTELLRYRVYAHATLKSCSHSVHFLFREPCSRSLHWFRRRADPSVVGLALRLSIPASALIPRGNKPLNPRSPVPAALHRVHVTHRPCVNPEIVRRWTSPGRTCTFPTITSPPFRVVVQRLAFLGPMPASASVHQKSAGCRTDPSRAVAPRCRPSSASSDHGTQGGGPRRCPVGASGGSGGLSQRASVAS